MELFYANELWKIKEKFMNRKSNKNFPLSHAWKNFYTQTFTNRANLEVKKKLCNTIHNMPTRAVATEFHLILCPLFKFFSSSSSHVWVALDVSLFVVVKFYTCNTLLFLLSIIVFIFLFLFSLLKFVFMITRHSLLMGRQQCV